MTKAKLAMVGMYLKPVYMTKKGVNNDEERVKK